MFRCFKSPFSTVTYENIILHIYLFFVCPVVNTGVFLLGCRIFFMPMLASMAQSLGFGDNVGRFMIIGLVGVNFLAELGVNIVLSPVILRLIRIGRKEN